MSINVVKAEVSAEAIEQDKPKTPTEKAAHWDTQLEAAKKRIAKWAKKAERINKRYLAEKDRANQTTGYAGGTAQLNLFYANVSTLESMLYGSVPKIDVSRKYADAADDVSRVAAETMQRLLNTDMDDNFQDYDSILRSVLQDRLLAGLGVARVRYDVESNDDGSITEEAPIDYYFWGDVLWGWGRNFAELPWIAFRNYLTLEEAQKRFGKKKAKLLKYTVRTVSVTDEGASSGDRDSNSEDKQAQVWEIWDKQDKKVKWYSEGCDRLLDCKADPLKLSKFFPCPPFFLANPTTTLYIPTPDYQLSEDLYNEIDVLQTRINLLTDAVKAVGVYDAGNEGVQRMFDEGTDNTLIPVDSWAAFAEKGGLQGAVDWMPIMDIVNALDKLVQMRDQNISLLQQVSGMADVMRGSLDNQYEGVGQSEIKAKFGSVRVQALQDQFARFASDLMKLKAEVIALHFSPENIVAQSNMRHSVDAEILPAAIQLIKKPDIAKLSVVIRPESVAMVDFAQMQTERVGFLNALSTFMQSVAPLIEAKPEAEPFLLKMLQWGMAGFKGAQEIEGTIDQAIEASEKAAKEKAASKEPSPEEKAAQMEQQKEQAKLQGEMQKIQAKSQADMQTRQQDMQADMQTAQAEHQAKMAEINASLQAKLAEIDAKLKSDLALEQVQSRINVEQHARTVQNEMAKDRQQAELDIRSNIANAKIEIEKSARTTKNDTESE